LKVIGWGSFYLSTILDDFSRYIIASRLFTGMAATDVQDTLNLALEETELDHANVVHRPRLLSDNGPFYISGELAEYLDDKGMSHTRGAPYHPQTQGKIERWHQTLKNSILLENYVLPRRPRSAHRLVRRSPQSSALTREPEQPDARRRLHRARPHHPA
jgi:putative transposase